MGKNISILEASDPVPNVRSQRCRLKVGAGSKSEPGRHTKNVAAPRFYSLCVVIIVEPPLPDKAWNDRSGR
jgi:hypothetical protein